MSSKGLGQVGCEAAWELRIEDLILADLGRVHRRATTAGRMIRKP